MGKHLFSFWMSLVLLVGFVRPGSVLAQPMSNLLGSPDLTVDAPAAITYTYPSGACNTTLQSCINGAASGDTIQILAGTITESLTLNKGVSLIGASSASTILKAPPNQRVLTVSGSITSSTVISNLTVTGGNAGPGLDFGGGIYVLSPAQPQLVGLVISNNQATTGGGLATQTSLQITSTVFSNNVASAGGGGMRGSGVLTDTQFLNNMGSGGGIWADGPLTILRGHFEGNSGKTQGGALVSFSTLTMTDTVVLNNNSTGNAGGVEVVGVGVPNITGGSFQGNTGVNGGALAANALIFNGTVFTNNTSTGYGGAFNAGLGVNGQNGQFTGNHAVGTNGYGGAIYCAGPMTLTNLTLSTNTADSEGGGIESLVGGTLTNSVLHNNTAPGGYGGGLSVDSYPGSASAVLDLSGTSFTGNSAYEGGGVYVYQPVTITGGTFTSNSASDGGGMYANYDLGLSSATFTTNTAHDGAGLYVYQGIATLTDGSFNSNLASSSGGGIVVDYYNLSATGTTFINNTATGSQGGGAWVQGNATITNGIFQGNHSGNDGGGLYTSGNNSISTLTQTDFTSNSSAEDGGGLYASDQAVVQGGHFQNNTALRYGGGWYVGSTTTMTNTVNTSNTATWGGGGYADGGAVLHGVTFTGNTATSGGGGGLYSLGQTVVTASRVAGNSALQGGGLYFWGGGSIVNSLLADNLASTAGADLYINFNGDVTILFSTIASVTLNPRQAILLNSGTLHVTDSIISNYAAGISVTAGSAFETYNLFYGNSTDSQGNVAHLGHSLTGQNPLFVNASAGDYHLSGVSPAIDHGIDAGIYVDYDGDIRPLGPGFDIGFDERLKAVLNKKVFLPFVKK
jgi:predicted outer membrane repeat protein